MAPGSRGVYQQLDAWKKEAALHDGFVSRPGVRFNLLFEGPAQAPIADKVSQVLEASYLRVGRALTRIRPRRLPRFSTPASSFAT